MRLAIASLLLAAGVVEAFAPASPLQSHNFAVRPSTARSFGAVDPFHLADLSQQFHSTLPDAFTSFNLADAVDAAVDSAATAGVADTIQAAVSAAPPLPVDNTPFPVDEMAGAAEEAAKSNNGWFGFLTAPIEGLLQIIHSIFVAVGVGGNAWGISIIILTILIKVVTFPLTKTQMESTNKMQAMQPAIKELQAKYQSNPEVMNQKIAEFYQQNDINPLAGCLPSLVQIPVFIGLYRAVLGLAAEDKLDEPFLWLPSLEGPTYGADPTSGSDWILKGWVDGAPSLGWDDTTAFLILPVLLVVSQFVSMELMQPKNQEGQQSNIVLKLLPLLIGWFSLNVPSALCIYWFTNNIITTSMSLFIKSSMTVEPPVTAGGAAAASVAPPSPIFSPPREKPAGFGSGETMAPRDAEGVKTITATAVDAEIVEEVAEPEPEAPSGQSFSSEEEAPQRKKKGRKRKGRKKKKN